MIFFKNDDQIGDYGRIEIAMRYFIYSKDPMVQIPFCSVDEMMEYATEHGAWPEFCESEVKIPEWYGEHIYGTSLKDLGVSRRRFKKFLNKIFIKYGEPDRVEKIAKDWNDYLAKFDSSEGLEFDFSYS
jgi:hypothetical protein